MAVMVYVSKKVMAFYVMFKIEQYGYNMIQHG